MPHLFPSFNGKAPSLIWCVLWATEKLYWVSIPQSFQIPLLTFVVKSSLRNSQFLYSSITFIYLCKLRVCFIPATPFQMAQQKQGPNICILVLILLFFFEVLEYTVLIYGNVFTKALIVKTIFWHIRNFWYGFFKWLLTNR